MVKRKERPDLPSTLSMLPGKGKNSLSPKPTMYQSWWVAHTIDMFECPDRVMLALIVLPAKSVQQISSH